MTELALVGPVRHSVNGSADARGSIHDDATATRLGLRGGTVAGNIHMELFPPLAMHAWGDRWLETGSLSLYFKNATTDREPVRAFMGLPQPGAQDSQVRAWIERTDGMLVAEGTIGVGRPSEPSALSARDLSAYDSGDYEILRNVKPGDTIPRLRSVYTEQQQTERFPVITELIGEYQGPTRWGGPVISMAGMTNLLWGPPTEFLRPRIGKSVGLFGAIEIAFVHGPALVGREYQVSGSILARGQSPKTEYFWFDTQAEDDAGRVVATMRMLLRFMKNSA
jgi:hypothetical protein